MIYSRQEKLVIYAQPGDRVPRKIVANCRERTARSATRPGIF